MGTGKVDFFLSPPALWEESVKIGVLSDIHSNLIALKACTAYLEKVGCDEYLFLGDYVSDTPYTRDVLDYLYEFFDSHRCYVLRGNREEYMLGQRECLRNNIEEKKWVWNSASGNLLFTYRQLTEKDFAFLESLPISFQYAKEGYPAITCCHGSPNSTRELLQHHGENTVDWLDHLETDYLLCAHTHNPGMSTHHGKKYFNPGAIGIAIHDYGFAQCMLLEAVENNGVKEWEPTFLKLPYDHKQVVEDIQKTGLLEKAGWFMNSNIKTLLTGVDVSSQLVELAAKLSQEAGEKTKWPLIEEKYFEQAAKMLDICDYR